MKLVLHKSIPLTISVIAAVLAVFWASGLARADAASIKVKSSSVTSEFPDGFRVKVEASADTDIRSIAFRVKVGQRNTGAFEYVCQDGTIDGRSGRCDDLVPSKLVNGELLWRTFQPDRYIPPGTIITYRFEIEDSEGNVVETDEEEFIYTDARFEWKEVSEGPITVAYHGPVQTRAQLILDAILRTLGIMGPVLGAETEGPIRVTMYNNVREMLGGLPPGSTTIRRELITAGQAFSDDGVLLTLGSGGQAEGTAAHEVTHILVHRAGEGIFRRVPAWINEGLAEYGNHKPSYSYDVALDFAVATDRLLPIMNMTSIAGTPEDAIIFYGQSRSIIRLMIEEYGAGKMKELMATLKAGKKVGDAIPEVYEMTLLQLENKWRATVGAKPFVPSEIGRAVPTPVPQRAILPYSLTPQPDAEAVGAQSDRPTPTPTAEPQPTQTATPPPPLAAAQPQPEPTAPPEAAEKPVEAVGCLAPLHGGGAQDVGMIGLLLGIVGVSLRGRIRRRLR